MLKNIREFISSNNFEMNIFKDKINIVNYKRIISISTTNISVQSPTQKIIITGNNLFLNKLLDEEILIVGKLQKIEVYDE